MSRGIILIRSNFETGSQVQLLWSTIKSKLAGEVFTVKSIALPCPWLWRKTCASGAGAGKQQSATASQSQSCTGNVAVALCYGSNDVCKLNLAEGSLGAKLRIVGFQLKNGSSGTLRLKKAEKLGGKDSIMFSSVGELVLMPAEI